MISRFNWERTVIGPHGPNSSTTRLVLLTLATHVHRNLECWPSLRTLAAECALSPRSVIDQLEIAAAEGWISKTFMRNERMRHKGNVYRLTLPSV